MKIETLLGRLFVIALILGAIGIGWFLDNKVSVTIDKHFPDVDQWKDVEQIVVPVFEDNKVISLCWYRNEGSHYILHNGTAESCYSFPKLEIANE